MIRHVLTKNWAHAIYELAHEENKVESFTKTLEELKVLFLENPEVIEFLGNNYVLRSKKLEFLDKVFKDHIDVLILNILKLIAKREIFSIIVYILDKAIRLLWESMNIKKGIIYSTIPIEKSLIKNLENKIIKKINKKIKLENKIDTSLIAGIRIEVANNVFDSSLKGRARDMKNKILENRK